MSAHPRWQAENEQNLLDLQPPVAFHSQRRRHLTLPQSAPAAASAAAPSSAASGPPELSRQSELLLYMARGQSQQL